MKLYRSFLKLLIGEEYPRTSNLKSLEPTYEEIRQSAGLPPIASYLPVVKKEEPERIVVNGKL